MNKKSNLSEELTNAMNEFVRQLPDADKSFHSTIRNGIILDHRRVTFMAQKTKGQRGMCWNINYKAYPVD
jgi:hypothetical protein